MAVIDESTQHPTEAMLGYTTLLEADLGDGNWQDTGEITDLTAWDASRDTVEVTNHRSPNFAIENIPGLIDFGSCSFDLNAVPRYLADPAHPQGNLFEMFKTAGNTRWRITFPDGTAVTFLAALTSYTLTAPVKDVMSLSCELAISGGIEWVQAAGGGVGGATAEMAQPQQALAGGGGGTQQQEAQ